MLPKIEIDSKSSSISIRISRNMSIDSEIKGKLVIDYDDKGEIVNLMLMRYSLDEFGITQKTGKIFAPGSVSPTV